MYDQITFTGSKIHWWLVDKENTGTYNNFVNSIVINLNCVLHIKPGNLLLATDGTLKISDFGVAEVS